MSRGSDTYEFHPVPPRMRSASPRDHAVTDRIDPVAATPDQPPLSDVVTTPLFCMQEAVSDEVARHSPSPAYRTRADG